MRVICRSNTGASLSKNYVPLGYTKSSQFALVLGREYTVHAMSIWRSALMLPLPDDNDLPNWYPGDAFEISDDKVPTNWHFRMFRDSESFLRAIWGYGQVVLDSGHYDGLIQRFPDALRIFREMTALEAGTLPPI